MLDKFREGVDKTGKSLDIRIIHGDIFKVEGFGQYDMVTGTFLNLFPRAMIPVLGHPHQTGACRWVSCHQ